MNMQDDKNLIDEIIEKTGIREPLPMEFVYDKVQRIINGIKDSGVDVKDSFYVQGIYNKLLQEKYKIWGEFTGEGSHKVRKDDLLRKANLSIKQNKQEE